MREIILAGGNACVKWKCVSLTRDTRDLSCLVQRPRIYRIYTAIGSQSCVPVHQKLIWCDLTRSIQLKPTRTDEFDCLCQHDVLVLLGY